MTSIRTVLAMANELDLDVHQMDVKTAFLNGKLSEDIYMRQPDGCVVTGVEHKVCKLNKALYGLKQASRCWFDTMNSYLLERDFVQNDADQCIYRKTV